MELLIFLVIALFSVGLALAVVLNPSPIGSAVSLIGMMLCLAGIFALQNAHFLAIIQILIYAGAIMVLFMFVIMLLNLKTDDALWKARDKNILLSVLSVLLVIGGMYKLVQLAVESDFGPPLPQSEDFGTTALIGKYLFTDFVLPFEVASILLLVAMIGALVLAKTKLD